MDKNVLPKFNCFLNPSTIGPQWTRWLTSFKLNANEKGLILDAAKAKSNATSPGWAGCAGEIYHLNWNRECYRLCASAFRALNAYFVPQLNSAFARQTFYWIMQNPDETVQQFITCLRKSAKDCDFGTVIPTTW